MINRWTDVNRLRSMILARRWEKSFNYFHKQKVTKRGVPERAGRLECRVHQPLKLSCCAGP
jgi:hypothetical protein